MKEKTKIGDFIVKRLGDKIVTKRVLESYDLYQICLSMGIWDDNEMMEKIVTYLDENNIDVKFNLTNKVIYEKYRFIELRVKIGKRLTDKGSSIKELIQKVNGVKVEVRPEWLDTYKDENKEEIEPQGVMENNLDLMNEIVEKYKNEMFNDVERQPTPSIVDILNLNE